MLSRKLVDLSCRNSSEVMTSVFEGTLSRLISPEAAGPWIGGTGTGVAGAAGAVRVVVRTAVVRAPVARPGVAGSAWVARAGRTGAGGATLRCGLRVPDSGVVEITLMSGSAVWAFATAGANSATATDPSAYRRVPRG